MSVRDTMDPFEVQLREAMRVDDGLDAMPLDRAHHRLEHVAVAERNTLQPHVLGDDAAEIERIARCCIGAEQDRGPPVGFEIARVPGKFGDQDHRRSISLRGRRNQRGIGTAGLDF